MGTPQVMHKKHKNSKPKTTFKKIWYFIWEDESIWSWIVNIILAFVIIKFLVYPGLGYIFSTTHPIVAVVSGSMEHEGSFDSWWNTECCFDQQCEKTITHGEIYALHNTSKSNFKEFSFKNGFNTGDIMVLFGAKNPSVGEVIVYNTAIQPDPIIHRIIEVKKDNSNTYYETKGDHNCGSANFEKRVPKEKIVGKAVLRIPYLGWLKIAFVKILKLIGII